MNTKSVISHIENWIKEYHISSLTDGYVIGVSGGIDSAVTSTLIAKTGIPLLCVEMPIHQNTNQSQRSFKHIKWLKHQFPNVCALETNLSKTFEAFKTVHNTNQRTELALANTRARLRMTSLYYYGQINNYLVAGTGNKIEDFGIGFFTKYGDGGVDLSPIADLKKSEVYLIGQELCINNEILLAPPTDGLWGGDKTDEDQIGASYPELEWAMEFSGDKKTLSKRKTKVLNIFQNFNKKNRHKMTPIPVCKIPKSLK